jgi:hypothetical protein
MGQRFCHLLLKREGDIEPARMAAHKGDRERRRPIDRAGSGGVASAEGRQLKRLKKKHDERNPAWAYHGNRGWSPANSLAESIQQQLISELSFQSALRTQRIGHDHVIKAIPGVKIAWPPLANGRGYAGKKVEVCQQPKGDFPIYWDRRRLRIEPATAWYALIAFAARKLPEKRSAFAFTNCPELLSARLIRYTDVRTGRRREQCRRQLERRFRGRD